MYDIDALERQWKRYRRKRMLRIGTIAVGILLVLGAPIMYATLTSGKEDAKIKSYKKIASSVNDAVGQKNGNDHKSATQGIEGGVLRPEVPSLSTSSPQSEMRIAFSDHEGKAVQVSGMPAVTKKKIQLKMTNAENLQVVKEIEARFPDTRDYDDAMYLAKYYYDKHQFRKAENWAMQANGIDSSQEESWLLYGKAKAKQGHRAEALRILQAYCDQSGSLRAKMLIDRIRKGKKF